MKIVTLIPACLLLARAAAQVPVVELRVVDEVIPAGQTVQIKLEVTEPSPISGGKGRMRLSSQALTTIRGISGFSPNGDLSGTALRFGSFLDVRCISPSLSWGLQPDYPILVIAADVSDTLPTGTQVPLSLLPNASLFFNTQGQPYPQTVDQGTLTVGGSLSVSNVDPGGGLLAAGTVVRVTGSGFDPDFRLRVNEISVNNIRRINSGEINFTLGQAADLTGVRIRVENGQGDRVEYYSYLRPIYEAPSSVPLLTAVTPIFPTKSWVNALFAVAQDPKFLTGVALQNPNATTSAIGVELYSATGVKIGSAAFNLASRHAIARELSEWLGAQPNGSWVRVTANPAVQMTGMRIDASSSSVSPVPARNTR